MTIGELLDLITIDYRLNFKNWQNNDCYALVLRSVSTLIERGCNMASDASKLPNPYDQRPSYDWDNPGDIDGIRRIFVNEIRNRARRGQ